MNLRPLRPLPFIALVLSLAGCSAAPDISLSPTSTPPAPPTGTPTSADGHDPFAFLSQDNMIQTIEDLSAIQSYSGWRSSGSQGEAEALDYIQAKLDTYPYLRDLGLEIERESYRTLLGTEMRQADLVLTMSGQEVQVPADSLRGHRYDITLALHFDSDGRLNDTDPNPVVVEGPVLLVRTTAEILALTSAQVTGRVVIVDYAALDRNLLSRERAVTIAETLAASGPAGMVLVTHYSNQPGESTGYGIADISALSYAEVPRMPPTLYVRLEDLAPSGIGGWEDLGRVESARLTWDADVFSPGTSGNLVARIPGADSTRAMILGAHIDSPNNPGAMDNASGSAVLLEVARTLDAAQRQPPLDLYLVWFGSEETGLIGSANFVANHQEVLDRAVAMLGVDCLSYSLEGTDPLLRLYTYQGRGVLPWPETLLEVAAQRGINIEPMYETAPSDSSGFTGFGVSNGDLIYETSQGILGHIHDPYDTVELAREMGDVLEQMARVALIAALDTAEEAAQLPLAASPEHRVLFVASHTEAIAMTPALSLAPFGATLAGSSFDVDLIPYGQPLTASDLEGADLVVALPVTDYAIPDAGGEVYDEAWGEAEMAALQGYVAGGGLLVLTNSAHLPSYYQLGTENEDWNDVNTLAGRFGVAYEEQGSPLGSAWVAVSNPLTEGVWELTTGFSGNNGVPFTIQSGEVLARAGQDAALAIVDYGDSGGQVLVLADVGWLGGENPQFWENLALLAQDR